MLMLRLETGIDFERLHVISGVSPNPAFGAVVDRYLQVGLLQPTPAGVKLSRAGVPVADAIAGELLAAAVHGT